MIKLILLAYTFNGGVSITDVNIGDVRTPSGFYFSTMEKCEAVGKKWDGRGQGHECLDTE